MEGKLFKYGPGSAHCAFLTGPAGRHVILVGGLTDGLLFAPYAKPLADALVAVHWSLVQPLLSSSYQGWGVASLDQDADELFLLTTHLKEHHGSQGVVIMGHSTGCQDAVRYALHYRQSVKSAPLLGVILQAPVSDRIWLATKPGTRDLLRLAHEMIYLGRREDILFRDDACGGAPVCARRWVSLAGRGGDDDMFSPDMSKDELRNRLGHMARIPSFILPSANDEYVPPSDEGPAVAGQRIADAMGPRSRVTVMPGNHVLEGHESELVEAILEFLQPLT